MLVAALLIHLLSLLKPSMTSLIAILIQLKIARLCRMVYALLIQILEFKSGSQIGVESSNYDKMECLTTTGPHPVTGRSGVLNSSGRSLPEAASAAQTRCCAAERARRAPAAEPRGCERGQACGRRVAGGAAPR